VDFYSNDDDFDVSSDDFDTLVGSTMLDPIRDFLANQLTSDIHLVSILPDGGTTTGRWFGEDIDAATSWAKSENGYGKGVYWTVNVCRPGLNKKPGKADIIACRFAHADIDPPKDGAAWSTEAALADIDAIEYPAPSFIIASGNGLQPLWRLAAPTGDHESVEAANRGLMHEVHGDAGTWNCDRLLRVPGTVNYPNAKKRVAGRVPTIASIVQSGIGLSVDLASLPSAPVENPTVREAVTLPDETELQTPGTLGIDQDNRLRGLIEAPAGVDGSDDAAALAAEMVRQCFTDAQIAGVLLNPTNAVSAHCLKTRSKRAQRRAAARAISWARSKASPMDGSEFEDLDDDFDCLLAGIVGNAPNIDPVAADDEHGDRIDSMNRKHGLIIVGGKSLIAAAGENKSPDFWQVRTFHEIYANRRVDVKDRSTGKLKPVPLSQVWMAHPKRRTYPGGIVFAPEGANDRQFNLWRGFSVTASPTASCEIFLNHLRAIICNGDEALYTYACGWLAHLVQHPADKPGVAMVLRGLKGTGKDVVGRYLGRMIGGRHVANIAQQDHILGKFNEHLQSALLVHVEEAIWAGSKAGESVLKNLLTAPTLTIERKGVDAYQARSCFRMLMSSNESWTVPASADERRFAVFDVSAARRGNAEYFAALHAEMEGDGPAALLHFLREYDLSGFNVRAAPDSVGLTGQKLASLRGIHLWWFEALQAGEIPGGMGDTSWDDEAQHIVRETFRGEFRSWVRGRRFESDMDAARFGNAMHEMLPAIQDEQPRVGGRRVRRYVLPKLADCREAFAKWIGAAVPWEG
jgi:hypothetical protein